LDTKNGNVVGKVLGRKAAVQFWEALSYIKGPLRKVTSATNGGYAAIEKIIAKGLRETGMSTSAANKLAAAIRDVLSTLV
jgi:hypothetical protein